MSEEHDNWLQGIGVDVQSFLGLGDAPPASAAAPPAEAPADVPASAGILSSVGSLASSAWDATKGAAGAVYDGYEKSTDFKPVAAGEGGKIDWAGSKPISLPQALGAGVDFVEKRSEENNAKMVESAKGIPVVEQLAQGAAWLNNTTTSATGGIERGVGDLVGGVANVFAHPIDSAVGIEGIVEHNMTVPGLGSTLKAAHGLYDVATGNEKGEYGSTLGDVASHVFDPRQQMEDDTKFDSNLARGILAPGTKDWGEAVDKLKANPADMLARAGTNVLPLALGVGEAMGGEAGAEAANAVPKGVVEPPPPTLRTPYLPEGVPEPPPFNPDIPIVDPEVAPNTVVDPQQFPKPPGEPIQPQPAPKLPGGPKKGPPIPREDPLSAPTDTQRTPIDIPGVGPEHPVAPQEAVPSGPVTLDAPPAGQTGAQPAAMAPEAADLQGMRRTSVGAPTGDIGALADADIDALADGIEEHGRSSTFGEMPGQNPRTGGGLQDIIEPPPNANPNQIAQHVNHYVSDVGEVRIAEASEVQTNRIRAPGGSVIPDGAGQVADPIPNTTLQTAAGDEIPNAGGKPIGPRNAEVRAHATNPRFPENGPSMQTNTPQDRFGWEGDRTIDVGGDAGRYLLPDGTWVEMQQLQQQIRAARAAGDAAEVARLSAIAESAHWPMGG